MSTPCTPDTQAQRPSIRNLHIFLNIDVTLPWSTQIKPKHLTIHIHNVANGMGQELVRDRKADIQSPRNNSYHPYQRPDTPHHGQDNYQRTGGQHRPISPSTRSYSYHHRASLSPGRLESSRHIQRSDHTSIHAGSSDERVTEGRHSLSPAGSHTWTHSTDQAIINQSQLHRPSYQPSPSTSDRAPSTEHNPLLANQRVRSTQEQQHPSQQHHHLRLHPAHQQQHHQQQDHDIPHENQSQYESLDEDMESGSQQCYSGVDSRYSKYEHPQLLKQQQQKLGSTERGHDRRHHPPPIQPRYHPPQAGRARTPTELVLTVTTLCPPLSDNRAHPSPAMTATFRAHRHSSLPNTGQMPGSSQRNHGSSSFGDHEAVAQHESPSTGTAIGGYEGRSMDRWQQQESKDNRDFDSGPRISESFSSVVKRSTTLDKIPLEEHTWRIKTNKGSSSDVNPEQTGDSLDSGKVTLSPPPPLHARRGELLDHALLRRHSTDARGQGSQDKARHRHQPHHPQHKQPHAQWQSARPGRSVRFESEWIQDEQGRNSVASVESRQRLSDMLLPDRHYPSDRQNRGTNLEGASSERPVGDPRTSPQPKGSTTSSVTGTLSSTSVPKIGFDSGEQTLQDKAVDNGQISSSLTSSSSCSTAAVDHDSGGCAESSNGNSNSYNNNSNNSDTSDPSMPFRPNFGSSSNSALTIGREGYYTKGDLDELYKFWVLSYRRQNAKGDSWKDTEEEDKNRDGICADGEQEGHERGWRSGRKKKIRRPGTKVKGQDPDNAAGSKNDLEGESDCDDDDDDDDDDERDDDADREISGSGRSAQSKQKQRAEDHAGSDSSQRGIDNSTDQLSGNNTNHGAPAAAGKQRTRAVETKNHFCAECGKRFSRPSQLTTHSFTHSGEKPHQCPMCRRLFNVASNLKRHIRTHSSMKRKSSRIGSMVFRTFAHGFQINQPIGPMNGASISDDRNVPEFPAVSSTSSAQPPGLASKRQAVDQLHWIDIKTPRAAANQRSAGGSDDGQSSEQVQQGAQKGTQHGTPRKSLDRLRWMNLEQPRSEVDRLLRRAQVQQKAERDARSTLPDGQSQGQKQSSSSSSSTSPQDGSPSPPDRNHESRPLPSFVSAAPVLTDPVIVEMDRPTEEQEEVSRHGKDVKKSVKKKKEKKEKEMRSDV
ncbi:hypothetical protein BG011_001457 [Mortierella polycephala]|uniref:C2H2-type domain-containing protein n=1 Tax=Mortierella polycephala TaxID=41804 RepID=A0A9P6Q5D2_9FUNG|nr:hypothetical protein BG011_001457 [Mortierella polycephala]